MFEFTHCVFNNLLLLEGWGGGVGVYVLIGGGGGGGGGGLMSWNQSG